MIKLKISEMMKKVSEQQTPKVLKDFCESTSLHGYNYFHIADSVLAKIILGVIILISTGTGLNFLVTNTKAYMQATIVTNIESSSDNLHDVVFPSITICNLNQVEASFLKDLNVYGNIKRRTILINEFIKGRKGNLSKADEVFVNEIKENLYIDKGWTFLDWSMQSCRNLFISISFRGMKLTWNQLPPEETFGPYMDPTDFGSCCFLVPHLHLRPYSEIENMTDYEMLHDLKADTLNGETNGLDVVIDAEQFNYAYHQSNAAGFKISLHHHLDLPMTQFSSQLIFTGVETQINLKPTITNTTKEAISFLSPTERQCYAEGEANLTYLPNKDGYRYEMNNCLIDQGIRDIIWSCRCIPTLLEVDSFEDYLDYIPVCVGEKLHCANTRAKSMGMKMVATENNVIVPEAMKNPNFIGNNISKPDPIHCMPGCTVQENNNQMSFAPYPQLGNFFYQKTFCHMASHIWKDTCQKENREYFMKKHQPILCQILKNFTEYFWDAGVKVKNSKIDDIDYTNSGNECTNKCQWYHDTKHTSEFIMRCLDSNGTWAQCAPFAYVGYANNGEKCRNICQFYGPWPEKSMCQTVTGQKQSCTPTDPCANWPENYFEKNNEPNETLVNELYQYGRQNLALIHVMVQSPYVTKIKRDVAMPFITFVANSGGLLGLCIGFSFISAIEILFWISCCCRSFSKIAFSS